MVAAAAAKTEVVELLLEAGADVDSPAPDGRVALHHAVVAGDLGSVKSLLEHGADVGVTCMDGKTPLDLARERNQMALMKVLMAARASREG
jgi:ankyrin repeat protein